ncbi:MAG: class II D-tagatose-bisphosphate aldolase, non-catalytic subunit [Ignavibacteria bacterium]
MNNYISNIVSRNKSGEPVGIFSVCSANRFVIEASMIYAKKRNKFLLIEATSNQVDQFGGYTGMTPKDFRKNIEFIAKSVGYPVENVILGGDHLGPNVWQNEDSNSAMEKAKDQIREYTAAGFTKLHLDTSMRCADDTGNPGEMLDPGIITERAAILCKEAESAASNSGFAKSVYIIGTDVPIPGGAIETLEDLRITTDNEVETTISLTKEAFQKLELDNAWERVVAIVVQPGVEFSDSTIFEYNHNNAEKLVAKIEEYPNLVYEAHSTDFQTKNALKQMVKDHFSILKVGPGLTFALREVVFALAQIENELLSNKKGIELSNFREIIDRQMTENPRYWKKHYSGNEHDLSFARKYSFSDRIRYYWSNEEVEDSLKILLRNLLENPVPLNLLSQYLPVQYEAVKEGEIDRKPGSIVHHKIMNVLDLYNYATNGGD